MKFIVAPLAEFPPGTRRIVRVDRREIGVFRVGCDFYAVRNRCPHQGGPLCLGRVVPRVSANQPGDLALQDGAPLVVCPWHGWHYDARTGEAYVAGDHGVKSYGVSVERGATVSEGATAPLIVETFPVYLEDDYVVLDA